MTETNEIKLGAPTKYSPNTKARILSALSAGLTQRQAASAAGICERTLFAWKERHPELAAEMEQAREVARQHALEQIQAAGQKDWRAWAEWLKLTFPEHRQSGHNINVTAQAGTQVLCDEATRQRLIAQHQKLVAEYKKAVPELASETQGALPDGCPHGAGRTEN
jgi:hypothetical protein